MPWSGGVYTLLLHGCQTWVWEPRRESMARRKGSALDFTAAALILCLAAYAPVHGQDMLIQTSMGGTAGGTGAPALTNPEGALPPGASHTAVKKTEVG